MKPIHYVLIAIAVLILGAIGYVMVQPSEYSVTNSVEINKPVSEVYKSVSDYNTWSAWSPWDKMEPTAKHTFEGTPGTVGHKMAWEGDPNNKKGIGQGQLTITKVEENKEFEGALEFFKPFESKATDNWKFEDLGGKTKVTWTNGGNFDGFMMRAMGKMITKSLDDNQKAGLANMKTVLEAAPSPAPMPADSTAAMPGDSVKPM